MFFFFFLAFAHSINVGGGMKCMKLWREVAEWFFESEMCFEL
jgi:hypothetical protein